MLLLFWACNTSTDSGEKQKQNILFIIVDDLRPQLGCYGSTEIETPNIDNLAHGGVIFNNNYCNFPVCGPSRASLFSGLRPHKTRFVDNQCRIDQEVPDIAPMNTHFKNNGYQTISLGKVYHHRVDSKNGWSENPWGAVDDDPKKDITGWRDYLLKENHELCKTNPKKAANAYEIADVEDEAYYDGKVAKRAIEYLNKFEESGNPFFMTVGFVKPHLPFNAPKKYYDLYPEESISLPENYYLPENAPDEANHMWYELRPYKDIPKEGPVPDEMAKKLIRGYYACASYADAMVGKLIDELKKLDLDENTAVVLIGDHGWHLGEHTLWCKHSNFEKTLRTTLIINSQKKNINKKVEVGTELVDIYPTMCELAGLPLPSHLEGESVVPLMLNPEHKWKEAVYSKHQNAWSVKTEGYLYTEWKDAKGNAISKMLYDHKLDKEENKNVAEDPEYIDLVVKHAELLNRYYYNKFD